MNPVDSCGGVVDLDTWPNCSVPDCEYKSCLSLNSDKCYAHTLGLQPIPFDEYMKGKPTE